MQHSGWANLYQGGNVFEKNISSQIVALSTSPHASRFHDASREPILDTNIAPYLDDNTQLSIGQYRDKLYEVCMCIWGRRGCGGGGRGERQGPRVVQ